MKKSIASLLANALALAFVFHPSSFLLAQGSLTPPGSPAPTMKSLDQIEPRTPVQKLTGDSANLAIISQSGSYYLTANVTGTILKDGISIQADNVTLDLGGFAVIGGSVTGRGIYVSGNHTNVAVRNGTVRNWANNGVDLGAATNVSITDLQVSGSGGIGIATGPASRVAGCTAFGNGGSGFNLGTGTAITNCTANENGGTGIAGATSVSAVGCTSIRNGLHGFNLIQGATLSACTATSNIGDGFNVTGGTLMNCSATGSHTAQSTAIGFDLGTGCTLTGCRASNNDTGLVFFADCNFANCIAESNPGGGFVTHTTGSTSDGMGCVFTGCSARGNGTWQYSVGDSSSLAHCTASGVSGATGIGIAATVGCSITECAVRSAAFAGISVGIRSTVRGCTVSDTVTLGGYGIIVAGDCIVRDCHSSGNVYGIHVSNGTGCFIEGNDVRNNTTAGISAGNFDVVMRNVAGGNNNQNYLIIPGAGVNIGPYQSPVNMTSPAANVDF